MILAVSNLKNPSSLSDGYRGRFAPSPTGPLHAGSLVAALGSWLDARANQGQWLVRMEDIDTPRCIAGADQTILNQLQACGLQWDGAVLYQSHIDQQKAYQAALERLNELACLYPCSCSRQAIIAALATRGIATPRHQEIVYAGTCRPVGIAINDRKALTTLKRAWRLTLPQDQTLSTIVFTDLRLGVQSQNLTTAIGDFVLRRSDGLFTYQLAVVVDDALQGITHIVRGEDLLSNTARQIYLQKLLGYPTPQYLHLPLVLNDAGEKLSKQTLASAIHAEDPRQALIELQRAAHHLGLEQIPIGGNTTIAEWLLAATQAWRQQSPS
jgi:glutamyl-Q tRNA(Asp) synthetase